MIPKSAARRLLAYALVLLPIIFNTAAQREIDRATRYQRRYGANAVRCQDVREIYFTAFFPCLRNMGTEPAEVAASGRLGDCDLLAEAAAHLAVERVNRDPTILPNITLKLFPIYTAPREAIGESDFYDLLMQYLDVLNSRMIRDNIWGVIGPDDNIAVASSVLSFTANSGIITASYGLRDTRFDDDIVTLYRTLPSSEVVNIARIVLLASNKWFRIASLGSLLEDHYLQERDNFHMRFSNYLEMLGLSDILLDLSEVFTDSPDSVTTALRRIEERDINIIVGFFGPDNARNVLCLASSIGLVSETHAWILPTYFDPNWWKKGANSSQCSDEEMKSILESVIFIDSVKFPPLDVPLDDFHRQLIAKSLDLFPSLTEEDLKPYLLRSRATNAYDAVTLLAKSVGLALRQDEGNYVDACVVSAAVENMMDCEYCKVKSLEKQCHNECSMRRGDVKVTENKLKNDPIFNHYGQVLYSQFIDGHEHPVSLIWTEETNWVEQLLYHTTADLDHAHLPAKLNLSSKNFAFDDTKQLLKDFQWKGPSVPDSRFFNHMTITTLEMALIGLLVTAGLFVATALLVFNITLRNNKIVKASSPRLNVIFLIGIILTLPTSFFESLAKTSIKFDLNSSPFTILCHCKFWMYYSGEAIFIATLLMKNWRIYRIFYNKRLRNIGKKLSDAKLMMVILLMVLPTTFILMIWSAIGKIRLDYGNSMQDSNNLQLITVRACCSNHLIVFQSVFILYTTISLTFLFFLTLRVANVDLLEFRREGLGSHRAVALAILPLPALYIVWAILLVYFPVVRYRALLWIEFSLTGLLPMLIMVVLFAPNVFFVIKEHMDSKRPHRSTSSAKKDSSSKKQRYHLNRRNAILLKSQLSETQQRIARLQAERRLAEEKLSLKQNVKQSAPDLTYTKRKNMHLTFIEDRSSLTSYSSSISDTSPQSVTTLFTCIDNASSNQQASLSNLFRSADKTWSSDNRQNASLGACGVRSGAEGEMSSAVSSDDTRSVKGEAENNMNSSSHDVFVSTDVATDPYVTSEFFLFDVEALMQESRLRCGLDEFQFNLSCNPEQADMT